jgi:hypothetical protein
MSAAERQQRRRARIKDQLPAHGTVLEFRLALLNFIETWRLLHPKLSTEDIEGAMEQLGLALRMDEWCKEQGKTPDWVSDYLQRSHWAPKEHNNNNWR